MLVLVHTHLCVYICSTTTLTPCSHRSEYQRFSLSVVDSLTMPILYHISRACVSACIREINANIDISNTYSRIPTRARLNWRKKAREETRMSEIETSRAGANEGKREKTSSCTCEFCTYAALRINGFEMWPHVYVCRCVLGCMLVGVLIVRSARLFVLVAWLSYRVCVCVCVHVL